MRLPGQPSIINSRRNLAPRVPEETGFDELRPTAQEVQQ